MEKRTLTGLFAENLYKIPDYQRGYAWEEKQWNDFIQDLDALIDDKVKSHYTGTIVVYADKNAIEQRYGTRKLRPLDVVDGQQRLTTACLYLSVIIRTLVEKGADEYKRDIDDYLYSGATCRLQLNNDTEDLFYNLLKTGRPNIETRTPHETRLVSAMKRFESHIERQLAVRKDQYVQYLKDLHQAITQKLHFTFYAIEEECEIGMTFELMNSRGKGLSVLELLKNYLMYWVSRNGEQTASKHDLTRLINKCWKETYTNLGDCDGSEDQCLRIAWTLYCSYTPKNWSGYEGFKRDEYIPLRNFSERRTRVATKKFIEQFTEGLAEISRLYATIRRPSNAKNEVSQEELVWLNKIHRTGNVANFLPLLVAAKKQRLADTMEENDYIKLLEAIERYAYRVFLFSGRRSNAGKSKFYRWASNVFKQAESVRDVIPGIYGLARYYSPETEFQNMKDKPTNWYSNRNRLKYTLFEYELHLLHTEGKDKVPHLKWEQLSDSTIEHILPQNPEDDSEWRRVWSQEDFKVCLHDIGNLVLTKDNSSYKNFDYTRKRGAPGQSPCYMNSDIRQERKVAFFEAWTRTEFNQRRDAIISWICNRWRTEGVVVAPEDEDSDEDDDYAG